MPDIPGGDISPQTPVDRSAVPDHDIPLGRQLRSGTNDLHLAVEELSDLPASVSTLEDYGVLLSTFYAAHAEIEEALTAPALASGWLALDIDIAGHSQLAPLTEDLQALGLQPRSAPVTGLTLDGPGQALGCLYVVEGSALGRRVLAPLFTDRLGEVPNAFFDARGRPDAWRGVQRSLESSAGDGTARQAVLDGARKTFGVFLHVLRLRAARTELSRG